MSIRCTQSDSVKLKMTGRRIMKVMICLVLIFLIAISGCSRDIIEKGEGYTVWMHNPGYVLAPGYWEVSRTCPGCKAWGIFENYICTNCGRSLAVSFKYRKAEVNTNDQTLIARLARTSDYWEVRLAAVKKLKDKECLMEIAKKDSDHRVRLAAVKKLKDKEYLAEIAKKGTYENARMAAVKKLTNKALLDEIAKKDSSKDVTIAARKRVKHLRFWRK